MNETDFVEKARVQADDRGRVTLPLSLDAKGKRFQVSVDNQGTILLVPLCSVPLRELEQVSHRFKGIPQ